MQSVVVNGTEMKPPGKQTGVQCVSASTAAKKKEDDEVAL
jgi:hypothetical protein